MNRLLAVLATSVLALVVAAPALATHAWGNYHWARTSNPFVVPLGDNVTNTSNSKWQEALEEASGDWTVSSVLNSPVTAGEAGSPKKCTARNGRIEVCNATYGRNGWLGLAQIWTSGPHIVKAVAKLNDTYYNGNQAVYDYDAERHVMCQEIGHGYGLGHQDESGADLNTCMDYSNDLDNPHPNSATAADPRENLHDYEQLEAIYSHPDSTSTVTSTSATNGRVVHRSDRIHNSYIVEDTGDGHLIHTFVTWAIPRSDSASPNPAAPDTTPPSGGSAATSDHHAATADASAPAAPAVDHAHGKGDGHGKRGGSETAAAKRKSGR